MDLTPEQALCALMLGTGETELILDAEVIRAVRGVKIDVTWHPEFERYMLVFRGMPDKDQLEAKGMKVPDVSAGFLLGATAINLGVDHPRRGISPHRILPHSGMSDADREN